MGSRFGRDCKLYHNTGTHAEPVWSEIKDVKDLNLPLGKTEADVSTRKTGKWKATKGAQREASIDFEMIWDPDDAGFALLLAAWTGDTDLELAVMDGNIGTPGSQGLWATMSVLKFDRNEPVADVVTASVSIKPTYSEYEPQWYVVPAA